MKHVSNSKPTKLGGVQYKSKLEADFAKVLTDQGVYFEYESKTFELIPTIKYNGDTFVRCSYTPDFILKNNIIIEAKGYPDAKWYIRKRLFIKRYILDNNNEYEFYEIHTKKELIELLSELKQRNFNRKNSSDLNKGRTITKKTKKNEKKVVKRNRMGRKRRNLQK